MLAINEGSSLSCTALSYWAFQLEAHRWLTQQSYHVASKQIDFMQPQQSFTNRFQEGLVDSTKQLKTGIIAHKEPLSPSW